MSIDEQVRDDLFTGLQTAVGIEPAKLMMTAIPPISWSEIATKADLTQFATRDEMHAEFTAVRNEMKFEFATVRSEMRADSAAIQLKMVNLDIQMLQQLISSFQNLFFQIAMFNLSTAGIVIAAVHYLW